MQQYPTYQFKALNKSSYSILAEYAITLPADVQLFPGELIINIGGNGVETAGMFIDDNGLDFHIAPIEPQDDEIEKYIDDETADPATLRKIIHRLIEQRRDSDEKQAGIIAEITKERDDARADRDKYLRWFSDGERQVSMAKARIEAISILLGSIFPKGN